MGRVSTAPLEGTFSRRLVPTSVNRPCSGSANSLGAERAETNSGSVMLACDEATSNDNVERINSYHDGRTATQQRASLIRRIELRTTS